MVYRHSFDSFAPSGFLLSAYRANKAPTRSRQAKWVQKTTSLGNFIHRRENPRWIKYTLTPSSKIHTHSFFLRNMCTRAQASGAASGRPAAELPPPYLAWVGMPTRQTVMSKGIIRRIRECPAAIMSVPPKNYDCLHKLLCTLYEDYFYCGDYVFLCKI